MSRFIIAIEASADLDEIGDYFLDWSVEAGERWFQEFNQKCKYLAQYPNIGRSYSDVRSYLRGLPLNGFILFYRLKGGFGKKSVSFQQQMEVQTRSVINYQLHQV